MSESNEYLISAGNQCEDWKLAIVPSTTVCSMLKFSHRCCVNLRLIYCYVIVLVSYWGCIRTDSSTSPSPGFRLRVVCHSYKLHPHEWSFRAHVYKHIYTQRCLLSIDNLQWNRIKWMHCDCEKKTPFYYIINNFANRAPLTMNNSTMT